MKSPQTTGGDDGAHFALPLDAMPMEARSAEALPDEPGRWQFEPKWDGFRCLAFKEGEAVELKGKSGKSLSRFFPEVVATLREAPFNRFVVDGELVIELQWAAHLRCVAGAAPPCPEPHPSSVNRNAGPAHPVRHVGRAR